MSILVLHVVVGLVYSLVTPIGEGHDEWAHFAYIRHIVTERKLPAPLERLVPEVMFDETHQPPLYYLVGALASSWVDMSDNLRPVPNTHLLSMGGGRNVFLHSEAEGWPFKGSVLGFHVVRVISVLMGTVTVLAGYLVAIELVPGRRVVATAALALTAFFPQLLYMGSIVNNDVAVAMFSTLVTLTLVRIAVRGFSARRMLCLFLWMGCAVLTKVNALGLLPAAAIVLALAAPHRKETLAAAMPGFLGIVVAFVGWEARNIVVPRHPTGIVQAIHALILPATRGTTGTLAVGPRLEALARVPAYAFRTFWGVFGWGNIPVDGWIYVALAVLNCIALAGCVLFFVRNRGLATSAAWLAPILTALSALLLPVTLVLVTGDLYASFPGRYVLSIAPAVGLFIAVGVAELAPLRARRVTLLGCGLGMFSLALAVPFLYIRPAYARPRLLAAGELPKAGHLVSFRFGDTVELAAYQVRPENLRPGQVAKVSLYWRSLADTPSDYSVVVQALDPAYNFYGGVDTNLGYAEYPTSVWRAGHILEQTYEFHLGNSFPSPAFARIKVAVYETATGRCLPAFDGQGRPIEGQVTFGHIRVVQESRQTAQVPEGQIATFGGTIRLRGLHLPAELHPGEDSPVTLFWECVGPAPRDYTVLVHLVDVAGTIVAQADGQPREGTYPTGLWVPGETVEDTHRLTVPASTKPGQYGLAVGLYILDTLERLPAQDGAGQPLAADQFVVPGVKVSSPN